MEIHNLNIKNKKTIIEINIFKISIFIFNANLIIKYF